MSYTLIPGLESFMEDTEVNVEVAVDAPEAIEEAEETADASAEIAETTEESEATDEQTEMIMAQFMELGKRYDHVKKYGVDRTFMRLYNSNDELSRSFRYRFPSCESFDSTGSPYSSESVACMEGIGEALSAIWDFIVNLCKKIGAFFGRLFEAIRVRFGNINDQIGRLRKMSDDRPVWVDNIDDVDAETYDIKPIRDFKTKVWDAKIKSSKLDVATLKQMEQQVGTCIKDLQGSQNLASTAPDKTSKELDEEARKAKKFREAFKTAKKEINKAVSDIKDDKKLKETSGNANDYLDQAATFMKEVDEAKASMSVAKKMLDEVNTLANNEKRRGDEYASASRKGAAALGAILNTANQLVSLKVGVFTKLSGMCVRAASTILRYKKKA